MFKEIALWAAKALALIPLSLAAYLFAPLFALFIVRREESEETGHPSLFPGMPREFLRGWLRVWQSPDAPVDEYYWADYEPQSLLQRYCRGYYATSPIVRWAYRVAWLWRNPAYGFGNRLGYSSTGMYFTSQGGNQNLWRTGVSNQAWWVARNSYREIGWCYQAQWHFYKHRCLEIYIGYKLLADGRNKSVAIRFNPFRQYPK